MPYKYGQVPSDNLRTAVNQLNRNFAMLDKETQSKTFRDRATGEQLTIGDTGDGTQGMGVVSGDKDRMFIGKYAEGRYGTIFYDADGVPVALEGDHPVDGHYGKWVVKPGENVMTELGA